MATIGGGERVLESNEEIARSLPAHSRDGAPRAALGGAAHIPRIEGTTAPHGVGPSA